MMSPGRGRFNHVPLPPGYSLSPPPESQIEYEYLQDIFSRLIIADSSPSRYVPPPVHHSNVFPYAHRIGNPYYQSQIPTINNNANRNFVQNNNYGGFVPQRQPPSPWLNDINNSNNLSLFEIQFLQTREILERQRREILDRQRREILDRQRRELLASILIQNPSFLDDSEYNHLVNERGSLSPATYWFDNFRGKILESAKDQYRSRVLQNAMMLANDEEISCIFNELIHHVIDLMLDSSGNYVIQRLVEICNELQRTLIIRILTMDYSHFSTVCKNNNGCRAFEKLFECITTLEQRNFVLSALIPRLIEFSKDESAHHVVNSFLKYFPNEDTKDFLEVVANMSSKFAKDKNGCCVLQECVNYAQGDIRKRLIDRIVDNSLELAEHCYGNYVVQRLVTLCVPTVTNKIIRMLSNNFVELSCNLHGSHVVEELLKNSGELQSRYIISELLTDSSNSKLLVVHPYANYVIGTALEVAQGEDLVALLELIQNNSQIMVTNLHGKKLLDRYEKEKRRLQ